jgi:hypothetical protein
LLAGCGGGSTPASEAEATISGIATPENVVVIQEAAASANLAVANYAAFNDAGTDYANMVANSWIDGGDWQEPFELADELACIMTATGAGTHPNEQYLALIEHSTCMPGAGTPGKILWASATMETSRADNNSPELVKAYYTIKSEDGSDLTVLADVKAVTAPTESNPWGEWDMNWDFKNLPTDVYDHGALSITKDGDNLNFKFSRAFDKSQSYAWDDNWANGVIKADRSGGQAQISLKEGWENNGVEQVYKVDFNTTHVAVIKNTDTATCQSLTSFTEYAYGYNIYTEDGAVVDITSELELRFGTNKEMRAWAGQYRSGGTATNPTYSHWMWTEDGSKPTTVYLKSDTSVSKAVIWPTNGNWAPDITDVSFDTPIIFNNTHADNDAIQSNDLYYVGMGRLYGINWAEIDSRWRPTLSLTDGTQLTAENGITYRVKRTRVAKTPDMVNASNCTGLDASTISFSDPGLTNTAKDIAWSTKPTVSSEAKVKHGVDQ